ncbi:MAG: hypothetical protein OSB29_00835 [Verrucomicrobiota bacterium]|nr:hypothetical protein [Verrucomicrobiota bacterium]
MSLEINLSGTVALITDASSTGFFFSNALRKRTVRMYCCSNGR